MSLVLEEVNACDLGGLSMFYVEGHVPRREFVGRVLSLSDDYELDRSKVVRLQVVQGYRVTAEGGDGEWCESNYVWYFGRTPLQAASFAIADEKTVMVTETLAVTYADLEGCFW